MSGLSIQLQGTLRVRGANGCHEGGSSPGSAFSFGLRPSSRSAVLDGGSARATVDSAAAFVAQPWTNGLRATVFYLRALTDAALLLRLTLETTGTVTIPCRGLEIQGVGTFEWHASGPQA